MPKGPHRIPAENFYSGLSRDLISKPHLHLKALISEKQSNVGVLSFVAYGPQRTSAIHALVSSTCTEDTETSAHTLGSFDPLAGSYAGAHNTMFH